MNSKITIEVDFDHDNQAVIQIIFKKSGDVRDNLIQSFLQSFGHESSWAKVVWTQQYREGPEPGHFDRVLIAPIKPDKIEAEAGIMLEQLRVSKSFLDLANKNPKSNAPMKMANGVPRRSRVDLMQPPELAIRNAILEVEKSGADEKLTNAVILLGQAKDQVSDYIDSTL